MLKAILVDDEIRALDILEIFLDDISTIQIIAKCTSAEELFESDLLSEADVLFLDVEMPRINGILTAKRIKKDNKDITIVFVTAHSNYAIEAFDVESIDYLLKPINKKRLKTTVERLYRKHNVNESIFEDELEIQCFGDFMVKNITNGEILQWRTLKTKELMALLVNKLGQGVERDVIIDNLWHQFDFKKGKSNLHTTVSYLNKSLRDIHINKGVIFNDGKYYLEASIGKCDLYDFYDLFKKVNRLDKDDIYIYEKIKDADPESYFNFIGSNWIYIEKEKLINNLNKVHQSMSIIYKNRRDIKKLQSCYEKIIKLNPYNENIYIEIIKLHISNNNRLEALHTYNELRNLLIKEIGVEPEIEIRKIIDEMKVNM